MSTGIISHRPIAISINRHNTKAHLCENEKASLDPIIDTFTQTEDPISIGAEDPIVDDTCIETQLDFMIGDGLLCDEEDEAIVAFVRRSSKQRTLGMYGFTASTKSISTRRSIRFSELSRAKRQSTLRVSASS